MTQSALGRHLLDFWEEEDGSPTIEFCFWLPFWMILFLSCFEMGMIMVRQTMLDRGVDLAVRQIRLGNFVDSTGTDRLTRDTLRTEICDRALIIPDCENRVRLEMISIDPRNWTFLSDEPQCRDIGDPDAATGDALGSTAAPNEITVLRACALFEPYSPIAGIGQTIVEENDDEIYALFSTSAFASEPR